ncbi:hypothetical protein IG631_03048 [Alternaria alternata]|nr:hypothetical protein IG631_03048 [Alternaria alternata]
MSRRQEWAMMAPSHSRLKLERTIRYPEKPVPVARMPQRLATICQRMTCFLKRGRNSGSWLTPRTPTSQ